MVLFLDIINLVQFTAGAGIIGHLEQNIVMLLQGLTMFLYFSISLVEMLGISV